MSQLRFSETQIYGRATEVQQLKEAFGKAYSKTLDRQFFLIAGHAGVGKSALAEQLVPTVIRRAGFFMGGKFDQQQQQYGDEPYSVFTEACRDLVDGLLAHQAEESQVSTRIMGMRSGSAQSLNMSMGGTSSSSSIGTGDNHISKTSGYMSSNKWTFTFQEVQEKLQQELGGELIQVLTTVFPYLTQILGNGFLAHGARAGETQAGAGGSENDTLETIGYNEAKNQFNYAFLRLMRVFCSFGPVMFCLDDVQWADRASLDLLETLMTDGKSTSEGYGFILLSTYRTEVVDKDHALSVMVAGLEKTAQDDPDVSLAIETIKIGNLTMSQVNELLMDVLSADSFDHTLTLAECIHRKTEGNIYYVKQFLKSLACAVESDKDGEETCLLRFNIGTFKWNWNVEEIKLKESATSNVVEILQQKLETLPDDVLALLPIVACLGASIKRSMLDKVLLHFHKEYLGGPSARDSLLKSKSSADEEDPPAPQFDPDTYVEVCVKEGILLRDKKRKAVRFEHDKVQEAALSMADEEALDTLRYKLGSFLLKESSQKEIEKNIFMILGFLDRDMTKESSDNSYYVMLAEMNLTASKRSIAGAAFESAAEYLARGISLLPEDHWTSQYRLSLELYSAAAETHYCTGKLEKAKERCNEVIAQSTQPILDKERAYTVLLESINAEDNTVLAEAKCIEVLSLLDCRFPKRGRLLFTIGGLMKASKAKQTLEADLLSIPAMTNPSKRWIMHLLDRLTVYSFQNKSDILPLVVFKALKYMLKYGISDYSPPLLCTLGILLAAGLGDNKGSHQIAQFTMKLFDSKKIDIKPVTKARVLFVGSAFGLHFCEPLSSVKLVIFDGYEVGLRSGDVESALWSIDIYLEICFHTSVPLKELGRDCCVYAQQMKALKQDKIHLHTLCLWQLVSNMLGNSKDPSELCGEAFDISTVAPDLIVDFNKAQVERLKIATAFWSGDFEKTANLVETTGASKGYFDEAFAANFSLTHLHFQCAMACFCVYRESNKSKYKRTAMLHFKHIQDLFKKGNPNVLQSFKLLQAEVEALKKNSFEKSKSLYKEAITLAGRQGLLQEQGLANERLGDLFVMKSMHSDAKYHFDEAARLFQSWGAPKRGAEYFNRKYGTIFESDLPSSLFPGLNTPSLMSSSFQSR